MKVAVFGYPRSGTTMLKEVIFNHLRAGDLITHEQNLGEPFNPLDYTALVPYQRPEGQTWIKRVYIEPVDNPMLRETRYRLLSENPGDYVLKVLAQDTMHPPILPWLVRQGYHFVNVERRHHVDALLSWLIAWNHQRWHQVEGEERPDYQPFVADLEHVQLMCSFIARYLHYSQRIPNARTIIYEDMCSMDAEQIVRQAGLYHEGVPTPPTSYVKLHSAKDKAKLIINLEEVLQRYDAHVGYLTV